MPFDANELDKEYLDEKSEWYRARVPKHEAGMHAA